MSVSAVYARRRAVNMDALVAQHAPLVKRIAYHLAARLPKNVQPSDLIQAGMIGLIEAARHYDPNQGASFETYAGIRIRGAILDEVRRGDWAPRSVHRRAREMAAAVQRIENAKGGEATDSEIAAALGVSLDEYFGMLQDISGHRVLSFEDVAVDEEVIASLGESGLEPSEHMAREELQANLTALIAGLPEREQMVLSLYYKEELNLKEIGEVLGVTESRVCQIHSQALVRLRARLSADGRGEPGAAPGDRRKPRSNRGVKA
jgi:RNA polymerase sigma factor for flagellar operon FliA